MATVAKFVQPIAIFLAYLIQLDVDVTGNITAKLCEVGSKFNIFCTLVTMATAAIFNLFNHPTAATHRTMLNFYRPFFMPCFGSHFQNGRHLENFENAELLL
jgi:hypothetical protein